jgi:hypothetical protein
MKQRDRENQREGHTQKERETHRERDRDTERGGDRTARARQSHKPSNDKQTDLPNLL